MAANSSRFVRSWLGTAIGGFVEVPINTAYEGEFLRHQIVTVQPRWAVIDDVFAERFVAIEASARQIEKFWIIDTGSAQAAIELLRANGWDASRWDELLQGTPKSWPDPDPTSLASIFFTSGTTGPSKGVAMPHALMYFFGQEVMSLTRLTPDDTYLTCTPLFHGNAQFMAAYPAFVAGAAVVVRSKFSASRWVDHLRANNVTVTNLIGVMMDFVWKAASRPDDTNNSLRCVYAAPTASSGWYYFVDRYKDALRRRGENVSSYEVEQALLGHPAVAECAVIGVPADVDAGEDEVLAVVVASGPLSAEELWEFCQGKIPGFAIPRFVRFVDALPKTPSEKVRKAVLRDSGITADTYDRTAPAAR